MIVSFKKSCNIRAGVHLKADFAPLNLCLNANISFAFQAIQKLSALFINLCFAVICKVLGDFWEEIVFLKGLVNFGEIRNIKDLIWLGLTLEFEVKNE